MCARPISQPTIADLTRRESPGMCRRPAYDLDRRWYRFLIHEAFLTCLNPIRLYVQDSLFSCRNPFFIFVQKSFFRAKPPGVADHRRDRVPSARLHRIFGQQGEKPMNDAMTPSQRADALEEKMSRELDHIVIKSRLYSMAEGEMGPAPNAGALMAKNPNARVLMGDDPRLPPMPEKPTLIDFFKYRFGPAAHLLQSARHAVNAGLSENMVLACLLHDISTIGFIRGDHGYWGAQLVEPYVDEEVTWAIRAHQVLRFYPDESVGYEYPASYVKTFGADYR